MERPASRVRPASMGRPLRGKTRFYGKTSLQDGSYHDPPQPQPALTTPSSYPRKKNSLMVMEDPNRPVTGYPAPNPNGYSANPPPSGTAYPYAAGAPPPNAYYNYQNNPYYQSDPNTLRRPTLLRRLLALVIGLIVVFAAITFIVWLVLRPQLPQFRVDSFSVSNFTLGNNSLISFTSQVRLTARNPNKKITLSYDHIDAVVFYRSSSLSDTVVPPFSQDTKSETSLTANFAAVGTFVDQLAVNGINNERGSRGTVGFNLRMLSRVRFKAKAWRTRHRLLKVFCGDLVVGIPSNGRPGTLTGGRDSAGRNLR
ncbi:hypothetical protein DH2020_000509 [Rehmannia glutinosa]|uniref:Late embryogenesis abundant protein LEA-2 subgroup domain-containing protein n=1 Tax=Rehmannia glutinosa TaxID=99300 RepID=A0ABR0XWQ0_REHGL